MSRRLQASLNALADAQARADRILADCPEPWHGHERRQWRNTGAQPMTRTSELRANEHLHETGLYMAGYRAGQKVAQGEWKRDRERTLGTGLALGFCFGVVIALIGLVLAGVRL